MQNCTECTKKQWIKTDWFTDGRRWNRCTNCGHVQLEVPQQGLRLPKKVLYFDIETSTFTAELFNTRVPSKYISWKSITEGTFVICWSAAWVQDDREPRVLSDVVTPREAKKRNDKRVLQSIRDLMDRADVVIAHNGKAFDIKKLNYRFLLNRIDLPLTYQVVDTLLLARKYYAAESNALEFWSLKLGGNPKDDVTDDDWRACKNGDPCALRKMQRYNRGDVREGINVYREFKASIESGGGKVYK